METILNTILCRNNVVPCAAAWASVVGLGVACWTLWRIQNVRTAIDGLKTRRLLHLRLPMHLRDLRIASEVIAKAVFATKSGNPDVLSLIPSIENVLKICENIKKLDEARLISPQTIDSIEDIAERIIQTDERQLNAKDFKMLYRNISALIAEVKVHHDNTKKEINDGF